MKIYHNQSYRPPEITGEGSERQIRRLPEITGEGSERQIRRLPDRERDEDFRVYGIEIPFQERRMVARGLRIVSGLDEAARAKIFDIRMHGTSLLTTESQAESSALATRLAARSMAAEKVAIELDTPTTSGETYALNPGDLIMLPDLYASIMRGLALVDIDDPVNRNTIVDQRFQAIEYLPYHSSIIIR